MSGGMAGVAVQHVLCKASRLNLDHFVPIAVPAGSKPALTGNSGLGSWNTSQQALFSYFPSPARPA
jgi:hypothetical protein